MSPLLLTGATTVEWSFLRFLGLMVGGGGWSGERRRAVAVGERRPWLQAADSFLRFLAALSSLPVDDRGGGGGGECEATTCVSLNDDDDADDDDEEADDDDDGGASALERS